MTTTTKTWEVGDRFRASDRWTGRYFTGTIVQVLDDGYLIGRWRIRKDGKRTAQYLLVNDDFLRYASKKTERPKTAARFTDAEARDLYERADAAGKAAAEAARPTPMMVGTPKNFLGSLMGGDDGGFDPDQPTYYVAEGVCGFAWVTVRPATSSFARWLKKNTHAGTGYYGGMQLWVRGYGQSMERKAAYAAAFAKVLTEAGLDAYSESRMD